MCPVFRSFSIIAYFEIRYLTYGMARFNINVHVYNFKGSYLIFIILFV